MKTSTLALLAVIAASLSGLPVHAADFTWNNSAATAWSAGAWSGAGTYPKSSTDNVATPTAAGRAELDNNYTVGSFTFGTAAAPVAIGWQVVPQNATTANWQLAITGGFSAGPATTNQLLFRNTTLGTLALTINAIDSAGQVFFGQNETSILTRLQVTGLTNITGGQVVVTSQNATFGEVRLTQGDPLAATTAFRIDNYRTNLNGNPNATVVIAGLSGTGGAVQGANAMTGYTVTGTLNVATATGASYNYGGTLIDGIGLGTNRLAVVKSGAGTQTFGGDSSYNGGTTVQTGTLLVTNTTGSALGLGAVSVANGATLGGTGRLALGGSNTISVAAGGTLAPGAGASGMLTLNGAATSGAVLNMAVNSTFHFTLGAGNTNGSVAFWNYAGSSDFVFSGAKIDLAGAQPGTYTLFQFYSDDGTTLTPSGISSGFDVSQITGLNGYNASIDYGTSAITLTLMPAPEPGTVVFTVLLGAGLLAARRKLSI